MIDDIIFERVMKRILLERGRFKNGGEFDAYLIGVNCSTSELMKTCSAIEKEHKYIKRVLNPFGNLYIFEKDEDVIEIMKRKLGEDAVDDLGIEFNDDLPVIVRIIQGDANDHVGVGKLSLADNLDWMVHDTWHMLVDRSYWFEELFNKISSIHISETLEYYIKNSILTSDDTKDFQEDCLMFLNSYEFTKGVGGFDCIPSLAAFCLLNRQVKSVPVEFSDKMKNYEEFNDFYKILHVLGPLMWKSIFKSLKGKIIFNTF